MTDRDENDTALSVQLLGPVRAWRGGKDIVVGPPLQRAVFAMLAARPDQAVARNELFDGVWGQDPPASAANGLHIYVSRLRQALEPDRTPRAPSRVLVASGDGYLLRLGSALLDVRAFEQKLAWSRAERATGDLDVAARFLDEALAWEALPLSGIPGPWAEIERTRLTELRLAAIEERIDVMLARGCHSQAAAELSALVRGHPLRERFRGQLMLALYRCGRQAEALAAFAQTRRILIGELGIEPGAELQRLHEQVLVGDAALDLHPTNATASSRQAGPIPQELPGDVDAFTGRDNELQWLDLMLASAAGQPGTSAEPVGMRIFLICGTAGVGKTALAVRWAHQARHAFPDGQLYIDMRGYDCAQPVSAADALARFLRSLGAAGQDIPDDCDERSVRYRSLLGGRRMLILIDNVAAIEQARPLLPGTSSCTVLVTSRDELTGLAARDGARRLSLGLLPPAEAVALLRALIGERADAEPSVTATLAARCARLPLALRVAADLAVRRRPISLAELVDELTGEQRRLDLLDAGGDQRTAVRAVLSWSVRHLPADAARAFRLLGLHPGPGIDSHAAAALIGVTVLQASRLLNELGSAHLLEPSKGGRFGMHDLLHAYASHLAAVQETRHEASVALERILDYYLAAASAAMDLVNPADQHRRPPVPAVPGGVPPMASPAVARAWLDTERATLMSVTALAAARGWPGHATALAATLFRFFDDGLYGDALVVYGHACQAAARAGDRAAEARALCSLGVAEWRLGRWWQAAKHHTQALALFRDVGDSAGQARALGNLGLVCWQYGRYQEAACHTRQALARFREVGDRGGEARALSTLGIVAWQRSRYRVAVSYHKRALLIYRELGDKRGEACALGNLGSVYLRQQRLCDAAELQKQALALFRDLGYRLGEARAVSDLGTVWGHEGRYPEAAAYLQQALALFRDLSYQAGEAEALNHLGELRLASGHAAEARAHFTAALGLTRQLSSPYEEARAHAGLGRCHERTGALSEARYHWKAALTLFTQLGLREACDVQGSLAALTGS